MFLLPPRLKILSDSLEDISHLSFVCALSFPVRIFQLLSGKRRRSFKKGKGGVKRHSYNFLKGYRYVRVIRR